MPAMRLYRRFASTAVLLGSATALPLDAVAFGGLPASPPVDSTHLLWIAAVSGVSIGVSLALFAFEIRSRSLAAAVRRLLETVVRADGRALDAPRESVTRELARLSDELAFLTRHSAAERQEFEQRVAGWESVFSAALDPMFVLDAAGCVTQINPAAERLLKTKAAKAVGRPLSDVMLPPGSAFSTDLAAGKAQGRAQELMARRVDGRPFPAEVSIAEFGSGEQKGFVATVRDISTARRRRKEVNRLRAEVEALKRGVATAESKPQRPVSELIMRTSAAAPKPAESPKLVRFTVDELCGDALRKLAARAERRGLGFRYEDAGVQGTALKGDAAHLRRVLISLVDAAIKVVDFGEVVVHLTAAAGESRTVKLAARVMATGMTEAQAARLAKPFTNGAALPADGNDPARTLDVFGTRVDVEVQPGAGASFRFEALFDADLSEVAIDLSVRPAPLPSHRVEAKPRQWETARLHQEFAKSAARLRKYAEKPHLMGLWAESHRLKGMWQRNGGSDEEDIGMVTALAHTSRGGDASNSVLLALRLAEALEAAARVAHGEAQPAHATAGAPQGAR